MPTQKSSAANGALVDRLTEVQMCFNPFTNPGLSGRSKQSP